VLTGTCAECHRVTTLVEGPLPFGTPVAAAGEETPTAEGGASTAGGPECAECGSTLTVSARDDGMLEVACAECETTTTFVPQDSAPPRAPRERSDRYERPRSRDDAGGEGASNARPCRQCGAPLKFTTDAEGVLTGECASCGNRFTLPPRRDGGGGFGRGDRGGGDRYNSRGPPRYGRKPGGYSGGGGGYGGGRPRYGGGSGSYRRREGSSDEGSSDDDSRRRRRPRRE
jgi:hypothetical protein